MLKNPTSCPTVLFVSSGISPVLHCLPSCTHVPPSPVPHNFARVLSAYSVAGKKPVVQVSGTKSCHWPTVLSVYWGYMGGLDSLVAVERTLEEMSGE